MANYSLDSVNSSLYGQTGWYIPGGDQAAGYGGGETNSAVEDFIYLYVGPVFFVAGIVGNSVAVVALCRPPLASFSSSVYLAAFAGAAVLVLVFGMGLDWCLHVTGSQHFKHSSESICRLWEFFDRMIKSSSVWFLIGGGVDRFIGLWVPHKAQDLCTVFIAKVYVCVAMVGITSLNVHALWVYELYVSQDMQMCYVVPTLQYNFLWQWASTLLSNLLPQSLIFLLGNLLVVRLCLKHRGRQIPETASIEMDLTYTTMIFAIIYGVFSLPSSIATVAVSLHPSLNANSSFFLLYLFTNYLVWVCYSCLVFILTFRSKAFRESVLCLGLRCVSFLRHGGATVEMRIMTEEYDQVPSTSTTL